MKKKLVLLTIGSAFGLALTGCESASTTSTNNSAKLLGTMAGLAEMDCPGLKEYFMANPNINLAAYQARAGFVRNPVQVVPWDSFSSFAKSYRNQGLIVLGISDWKENYTSRFEALDIESYGESLGAIRILHAARETGNGWDEHMVAYFANPLP